MIIYNMQGVQIVDPKSWISKAQLQKLKKKIRDNDFCVTREMIDSIVYSGVDQYSNYETTSQNGLLIVKFEEKLSRQELLDKLHAKKRHPGPEWNMYYQLKEKCDRFGMTLLNPIECKKNPEKVQEQKDLMAQLPFKSNPFLDYYNMVDKTTLKI